MKVKEKAALSLYGARMLTPQRKGMQVLHPTSNFAKMRMDRSQTDATE